MSKLLSALGHAIRQVREDRNISQEGLAELAGLHRTYISSVEQGRRNLSVENIHKIATALGVSMTELIQLCEDRLDRTKGSTRGR
ncbi:MAG TPA: helix-turn-helix transcriptional regulator [Bryobacteraceae bacterium]